MQQTMEQTMQQDHAAGCTWNASTPLMLQLTRISPTGRANV